MALSRAYLIGLIISCLVIGMSQGAKRSVMSNKISPLRDDQMTEKYKSVVDDLEKLQNDLNTLQSRLHLQSDLINSIRAEVLKTDTTSKQCETIEYFNEIEFRLQTMKQNLIRSMNDNNDEHLDKFEAILFKMQTSRDCDAANNTQQLAEMKNSEINNGQQLELSNVVTNNTEELQENPARLSNMETNNSQQLKLSNTETDNIQQLQEITARLSNTARKIRKFFQRLEILETNLQNISKPQQEHKQALDSLINQIHIKLDGQENILQKLNKSLSNLPNTSAWAINIELSRHCHGSCLIQRLLEADKNMSS